MNNDLIESTSPVDPREVCRAICMQRQTMPTLGKGVEIWVWYVGEWRWARVLRRMPGNVYYCELLTGLDRGSKTVASANTFGGLL